MEGVGEALPFPDGSFDLVLSEYGASLWADPFLWVPEAARVLRPGGRLVINAIRKEAGDRELMATIRYEDHLWQEKEIKSVANVTARDIADFLPLAAEVPLRVNVQTYALEEANQALVDLRAGHVRGAKVLIIKTNN